MFTKIFTLLLFAINYLYSYENLSENTSWQKLLYIKDQKNSVISEEFFLSNTKNPSAKEELTATLNLLRSKHGQRVACNYPARYRWLKKKVPLPAYELSTCRNLNAYLNGIQKEELYLVFTSEYMNNPSSSFGHIMLVLKDSKSDFKISDTIHFAAKTQKDSFLSYSYKGLTGKYNGYFVKEKFFKKMYQYNMLEQRFMYMYRIDFSKEEILNIIYALYELRKATFKYYFLDGNCSSYIMDLLALAKPTLKRSNNVYTLPIDAIKEYQPLIKNIESFEPLISSIQTLINQMNVKERNRFMRILNNHSIPLPDESDIVKETLVYYYKFMFKRFRVSYQNYNDIMKLMYKKTKIEDDTTNPLYRIQSSKFDMGFIKSKKFEGLNIRYRPMLIDLEDIQYKSVNEKELTFFDISLLINDEVKVEYIDILKLESLPRQLIFYKPLSWKFYVGLNRENIRYKLALENEIGLGFSQTLFENLEGSILFNVGSDIYDDEIRGYIKPELLLTYYLDGNTKIGTSFFYKNDYKSNYVQNEFFITQKIKSVNTKVKYVNKDNDNNQLLIHFSYDF